MVSYKIEVSASVRKKDLSAIPPKDVGKIITRIATLADNPFPVGSVRLKGRSEWRIRQGVYRILYTVNEQIITVFVIKVGHRRDIYRK